MTGSWPFADPAHAQFADPTLEHPDQRSGDERLSANAAIALPMFKAIHAIEAPS